MNTKSIITALLALTLLAFASCGSDEPQWADPEGHERTEQLRKQYGPLIVGSWHYEKVGERQRFFATFGYADETTLHIQGYYVHDDDGWADYQRSEAESSF
jgi:hypothetical protein